MAGGEKSPLHHYPEDLFGIFFYTLARIITRREINSSMSEKTIKRWECVYIISSIVFLAASFIATFSWRARMAEQLGTAGYVLFVAAIVLVIIASILLKLCFRENAIFDKKLFVSYIVLGILHMYWIQRVYNQIATDVEGLIYYLTTVPTFDERAMAI